MCIYIYIHRYYIIVVNSVMTAGRGSVARVKLSAPSCVNSGSGPDVGNFLGQVTAPGRVMAGLASEWQRMPPRSKNFLFLFLENIEGILLNEEVASEIRLWR